MKQEVPLWRQLQATASVVREVASGVSATMALEQVGPDLRPGVQALVLSVLRHQGRAKALRQLLAPRTPPPGVEALLCTALALASMPQDRPYEPHTLVNQAVEAAKKTTAIRAQSNFINACLRRFLREQVSLLAQAEQQAVAKWNHPQWWIDLLRKEWPLHWEALLEGNNRQPPMTLRVNVRKTTVADYLAGLQAAGINAKPLGETGVVLAVPMPVHLIPGFSDGVVSVQDAAAQLAAPLLLSPFKHQEGATATLRVLDACAAPGGKTAHLLEYANCDVTALEVNAKRCERIQQTLQRVGLQANVLCADAARVEPWWDGQAFDAILLDAPCSASGIVRRHPDVRWLRRATDIAQLAKTQVHLLKALWPLLAVGGRLLYCTCSVFKEEGEGQIRMFLENNINANLLPSPGHLFASGLENNSTVPDNRSTDYDGFYYALLEKRAP